MSPPPAYVLRSDTSADRLILKKHVKWNQSDELLRIDENRSILRKHAKSKQSDVVLSIDELWEICSRMPAKAAIKLSSLSKSLSKLVSDPLLVERQTIRSSLFDGAFFLRRQRSHDRCEQLEFHVFPSSSGSSIGIPRKSVSFLEQYGSVLCSSHGLVLVRRGCETDPNCRGIYMICNPATGRCASLPFPDLPQLKSEGLGFKTNYLLLECHPRKLENHSSTPNSYFPSDYTVIAPIFWDVGEDEIEHCWDFAVYRNGKWEDTFHLKIEGRDLRVDMIVAIFRGSALVLHYLCDSLPNLEVPNPVFKEPYIVAYDVEKRTVSKTFMLPKDAWKLEEDGDFGSDLFSIFKWRSLGEQGETITLTRTDSGILRVWVLEDYERGIWRTVVSKKMTEIGVPSEESLVFGECVFNATNLLFASKRRIYVYNMDAARLEVVPDREFNPDDDRLLEFIPYANTLRPVTP